MLNYFYRVFIQFLNLLVYRSFFKLGNIISYNFEYFCWNGISTKLRSTAIDLITTFLIVFEFETVSSPVISCATSCKTLGCVGTMVCTVSVIRGPCIRVFGTLFYDRLFSYFLVIVHPI